MNSCYLHEERRDNDSCRVGDIDTQVVHQRSSFETSRWPWRYRSNRRYLFQNEFVTVHRAMTTTKRFRLPSDVVVSHRRSAICCIMGPGEPEPEAPPGPGRPFELLLSNIDNHKLLSDKMHPRAIRDAATNDMNFAPGPLAMVADRAETAPTCVSYSFTTAQLAGVIAHAMSGFGRAA